MAETISTNQFKNGMHVEVDGVIWRIVEFQHVKPGKGGAFVRTKLKALETGKVVDKTFRAGETMLRVHTSANDMQFLYDDGDRRRPHGHRDLRADRAAARGGLEEMQYVKENDVVQLLSRRAAVGAELPASVELAVTETEPGVKGDTVST